MVPTYYIIEVLLYWSYLLLSALSTTMVARQPTTSSLSSSTYSRLYFLQPKFTTSILAISPFVIHYQFLPQASCDSTTKFRSNSSCSNSVIDFPPNPTQPTKSPGPFVSNCGSNCWDHSNLLILCVSIPISVFSVSPLLIFLFWAVTKVEYINEENNY